MNAIRVGIEAAEPEPWTRLLGGFLELTVAGGDAGKFAVFHHLSSAPKRLGLPNLDLELQLVPELLPDPLADPFDELEHVASLGAGISDDEIGVTIGDFGPAESRAFESGLIDERTRR